MNNMFYPYMNYPQSYPQFPQDKQQAPVQNIFTNSMPSSKDYFMARFLKKNETPQEEITTSKTALIDLNNAKLYIKEATGELKEYEIKLPLDEKDLKIKEQESQINSLKIEMNKLKEMISSVSTVPTISAIPEMATNESNIESTKPIGSTKKNDRK